MSMSKRQVFTATFIGWPLAMASVFVGRATLFSASFSFGELAGWAFLCSAPLAIFLMLFRGQATPSVAQVLYDAEHQSEKDARKTTVPRA